MTAAGEQNSAADAAAPAAPAAPAVVLVPKPLEHDAATVALEDAVKAGTWLGCAVEEDPSAGTLFSQGYTLWVSAADDVLLRFAGDAANAALRLAFAEGHVAAGDVKALFHRLSPVDSSLPETMAAGSVVPDRIFDVGVAAYLLESDRSSFEVRGLAEQFLSSALPEEDAAPAAAVEAVASRLLVPVLAQRLANDGSADVMDKIEMPLLPVLAQMERVGLSVRPRDSRSPVRRAGRRDRPDGLGYPCHGGEDFNIDSPQQLSHILFDVCKLPTFGMKRTKRGFYSTNAKVLADLAQTDELVAKVLEYRERAKIKSTYLDALPALIRGDHRIHTTFNQTVAATGRLSSSDPNLQNIPTRSELGHRVRTAFTVPEGSVFLACDYSQIELRLLAHLSGDEHLIAAFNEGADFHAATAARVFGVPVEEVTPQLRSRAKAVNFGIVYGQQAYGLATSLKIPRAEAQQMIDRYFEAYPGVRAYLDQSVAFAHEHGYAITMYGRKRHIREFQQRNKQLVAFGERTAMNHPMQGTAADIIKIAMVRVEKRLAEEGLKSKLVLQIHDELDLEVPVDEIDAASALVKETMEGVAQLKVPLIAEVSSGATWADAK